MIEEHLEAHMYEEMDTPFILHQFQATQHPNKNDIEYTLRDTPLSAYLELDSKTGVLTVVKRLDREVLGPLFNITIDAIDLRDPSRKTENRIVVILTDVNEFAPHFQTQLPDCVEVPEDTSPGSIVYEFAAYDRDDMHSNIRYSKTTNSSDFFDVSRTDGEGVLRLVKDLDNAEETESFDVWVVAQEEETPEAYAASMHVRIKITSAYN